MLMDMTTSPAPRIGKKASLLPISFNDTLFLSPNMRVDSDFEILTLNLGQSNKESDKNLQKSGLCIINEEIKRDKGLTNANYFQFKLINVPECNPLVCIGVCTSDLQVAEQISK